MLQEVYPIRVVTLYVWLKRWLDAIKTLEIIQFAERDTGRAIRMFQTINDRGLPLTAMDKAKALLRITPTATSTASSDHHINICFGSCFAAFDAVVSSSVTEDSGLTT